MSGQHNNNNNNMNVSADGSCGRCEENMRGPKQSMAEMEQHYEEKIKQARTALDERQKLFNSFKDRMGGDCESMDSSVSETRLETMYAQFYNKWTDKKEAYELIRGMFEASRNDMDKEKQELEKMFKLDEHSTSPPPKEVAVYTTMAVQNLQMAVYHSRKEHVAEVPLQEYQERERVTFPKEFRDLAAECYWLGCLMTLNNPPLHVKW